MNHNEKELRGWQTDIKACFLTEKLTDYPVPTVRVNPDTLLTVVKALLTTQIALAKAEEREKVGKELYDLLPSGNVDAFHLITLISEYIVFLTPSSNQLK